MGVTPLCGLQGDIQLALVKYPPPPNTHTYQDKLFLNIPSAIISDKLRNIIIIPCSVMTIHFSYFISRVLSNSEGFLIGNSNVCLSLSWEFPLQIGLFTAQAKTQHLLKLQLACNLYNLLFICASRGSLYAEIFASNYINNVLENILLKSLTKLNDPLMRMRCC